MPEAPSDHPHIPVLLDEVIEALEPVSGAHVLDGTFGAGGYSEALLSRGASVLGIDRDPRVQPHVARVSGLFPSRFEFLAGTFSTLDDLAAGRSIDRVVLDIGVSSMQLDEAERGFSFMRDGPLDMRMSADGTSAADLVNTLEHADLANLLYAYGEERKSRRIADFIIRARTDQPVETTLQLARIIERAIGRKPGDPHPATRSFQALRIAVNAELDELVEGLFAAERLLPEGGRLAVVTFHSLEDRIVKRFFDPDKAAPTQSRHLPQVIRDEKRWDEVARSVKAGPAELGRNPRARSATLRSARRTGAAARPASAERLGLPNFSLEGVA